MLNRLTGSRFVEGGKRRVWTWLDAGGAGRASIVG